MSDFKYFYIDTNELLARVVNHIDSKNYDAIDIDFETSGLDPHWDLPWLCAIRISNRGPVFVIDVQRTNFYVLMKSILENCTLTAAEAKMEVKFLKALGIESRKIVDVIHHERLLSAGLRMGGNDLESLAMQYTGIQLDKSIRHTFEVDKETLTEWKKTGYIPTWTDKQIQYSAMDTWVLSPIREQQYTLLNNNKLEATALLENRLVPVTSAIEYNGVYVDENKWRALTSIAEDKAKKLYDKTCELLAGPGTKQSMFPEVTGSKFDIDLNSAEQILVHFKALKIKLTGTDEKILKHVKHPAAASLLEYREQFKLLSSYGRSWIDKKNPITNRIHPSINQIGARSGRQSIKDPNTQQIPGNEYRLCFIAPDNTWVIISADYSQIELRILAEIAKDPNMIQIINSGGDIHSQTAAMMFGIPLDQCGKGSIYRTRGKTINFAQIYGQGIEALALSLGISTEEAKDLQNKYFAQFPMIKRYMSSAARFPFEHGYTETLLGRKRFFPHVSGEVPNDLAYIMRSVGKNHPIQGCVRGNTKVLEQGLGYKPIESLVGSYATVWDGSQWTECFVTYSGKKQLIRITLMDGNIIECSPEHKFLVTDTRNVQSWKTAIELSKSSKNIRLLTNINTPNWDGYKEIPIPIIGKSWNSKYTCISKLRNLEQAGEWLGRLASDGCVSSTQTTLLVAEDEENILDYLTNITSRLGHITHHTRTNISQPKRLHNLTISSVTLSKQLNDMGVKYRIPDIVWSNKHMLVGYIRGMFDGDGTVNKDGAVLVFGKGITHLDWAREIQQGLLLLGIRSRVRSYKDKSGGRTVVCILKADMPKFTSEIGFINIYKQKKALEVIPSKRKGSAAYGKAVSIRSIEILDNLVDMYDIVNSNTKQYMANGLITHNTSADITKLAQVILYDKFYPGDSIFQVNVVHDEIVFQSKKNIVSDAVPIIKNSMIDAAKTFLKLADIKVDVTVGDCWSKGE